MKAYMKAIPKPLRKLVKENRLRDVSTQEIRAVAERLGAEDTFEELLKSGGNIADCTLQNFERIDHPVAKANGKIVMENYEHFITNWVLLTIKYQTKLMTGKPGKRYHIMPKPRGMQHIFPIFVWKNLPDDETAFSSECGLHLDRGSAPKELVDAVHAWSEDRPVERHDKRRKT